MTESASSRLVELLASTEPPLDDCLLLVSEALGNVGAVARGRAELDRLAAPLDAPDVGAVIDHLFVEQGFRGDVDDYHHEDNSLLDRVLERRRGMPITLAATMMAVGSRVGLGLHGIAMPGHFLVGIDGSRHRYVDAFAGVVLDFAGAAERFHGLFGRETEFDASMLAPVSTPSIVARVLNNLTRTYAERDPARLDALLDLRVALPGPKAERRLLIRLAEARARWDVAARIREEIDPDDREALGLRARLN